MNRLSRIPLLAAAGPCLFLFLPLLHAQSSLPDVFPPDGEFAFPEEQRQELPSPLDDSRRITRPDRSASASPQEDVFKPETGTRRSVWAALGPLALIIVLILAAAAFWKKHGPLVNPVVPPEALELLGKRHLDQRQSIHLVRLGSRILVLGSSAHGLRTLAEITDPVEVDSLAGFCRRTEEPAGVAHSFRALFHRQSPAPAGEDSESRSHSSREQPPPHLTGEQQFAERLREMSASQPQTPPGSEDVRAA